MIKEFVLSEQALQLKEMGFDEPCFTYWIMKDDKMVLAARGSSVGLSIRGFKTSTIKRAGGVCIAPVYQQIFDWLNDSVKVKWNIHCWVQPYSSNAIGRFQAMYWSRGQFVTVGNYATQKKANEECLKAALKIALKN